MLLGGRSVKHISLAHNYSRNISEQGNENECCSAPRGRVTHIIARGRFQAPYGEQQGGACYKGYGGGLECRSRHC